MKLSSRLIEDARRQASGRLSPDFSRRVIALADARRRARNQLRIALITGALCLFTTVSADLIRNRMIERQNLMAWQTSAAELRVIQETI